MVGTATLIERESSDGVKVVEIKREVKGLKGKHPVRIHERANGTPSKLEISVSFEVEVEGEALVSAHVSGRRHSDRCVCSTLMQKYAP